MTQSIYCNPYTKLTMEPIRGIKEIIDSSYRYKMEKLNFDRRRNLTFITNFNSIATSLKIPSADLIIAFIRKKLSIQIIEKDGVHTISKDIVTQLVVNALYEFIEYFVLCKKCRLPELDYLLDKNRLETSCRSCGLLSNVDNNSHTDKIIKQFETLLKTSVKTNNKQKPIKVKKAKFLDQEEIDTKIDPEEVETRIELNIEVKDRD